MGFILHTGRFNFWARAEHCCSLFYSFYKTGVQRFLVLWLQTTVIQLQWYIQGCGLQVYSWLVVWYNKCRSVFQKPQDDVLKCQRYSVCCHSKVKELENIHIKEARIREFWLYCSLDITQSELFIKNGWGLIWWLTTNWLETQRFKTLLQGIAFKRQNKKQKKWIVTD